MKKPLKSKKSLTVAAVDIGTNSIRCMVLKKTQNRQYKVLFHDGEITRLGQGLHQSGRLKKGPQERTLKVIKKFLIQIRKHHPKKIDLFGTSAMREAENGKAFAKKLEHATGEKVRILSGNKEAQICFNGIINSFTKKTAHSVLLDIGGGSTELVWKDSRKNLKKLSLKIGAVRLHEMFLKDPEMAVHRASEMVKKKVPRLKNKSVIGAGGTMTTLAAIDQKLKKYRHKKIHGYKLPLKKIEHIGAELDNMTLNQRKKVSGLSPKRADIIVSGILIAVLVLEYLKADKLTVSDRGILYGACLDLLN